MSGSALGQLSGTYTFNPSVGETAMWAFGRCGIRRTMITAEHMQDARISANMILSDWSNQQPNLWEVTETTTPCVEGQAAYTVDPSVMIILDAFLRMNAGTADQTDYYMLPISRTEWASFPDKVSAGRPTVYWFDRLLAPTVTLWQPPSDASWEFHYYSVGRLQDANLEHAGLLPVPTYFTKAFGDRLAAELAVTYAPDRAVALYALAKDSWERAAKRNTEDVPYFVAPGLSGYYRV